MTFQPVNSLLSWFIATEWKQFSTIYALCFTGVCVAYQIAPIVKYSLNWGWCAWSAEGSLKQCLPNGNAFVVSRKMPWCALLTAVKNYTKVLKNCKTFSSRPRPNVQDQDFMIQDQDFHFCPRGALRPRPWSRALHHWVFDRQVMLENG